ncbi:hypothetical protein BKA93DRAFT_750202 [Sparassis latifolia]
MFVVCRRYRGSFRITIYSRDNDKDQIQALYHKQSERSIVDEEIFYIQDLLVSVAEKITYKHHFLLQRNDGGGLSISALRKGDSQSVDTQRHFRVREYEKGSTGAYTYTRVDSDSDYLRKFMYGRPNIATHMLSLVPAYSSSFHHGVSLCGACSSVIKSCKTTCVRVSGLHAQPRLLPLPRLNYLHAHDQHHGYDAFDRGTAADVWFRAAKGSPALVELFPSHGRQLLSLQTDSHPLHKILQHRDGSRHPSAWIGLNEPFNPCDDPFSQAEVQGLPPALMAVPSDPNTPNFSYRNLSDMEEGRHE